VVWTTKACGMAGTEKNADKIVQTAMPTKPAKDKSEFFFKKVLEKKAKKLETRKLTNSNC
jgi:hypothetical protein